MNKLVSVIIPCYNDEKFIGQALESVIQQTYKNIEIIVVDDCSTDNSIHIIKEFTTKYNNVILKSTFKNSGVSVARNVGIAHGKGVYIAFLDSDDIWLPNKLEKQVKVFDQQPDAAIVYSNYEKISFDGKRSSRLILAPDKINYKGLLKSNVIGCLTAIYNTKLVGKATFDKIGHEDFALWLKILKKGFWAYNANEVLALYRVSSNSLSSNKIQAIQWTWYIYRIQEKLSFFYSLKYFTAYAINSLLKRLK